MLSCRLVDEAEAASADMWLLNTCTVKSPSQSAMDTLILRGRALGKPLLVAGCVPQVGAPGHQGRIQGPCSKPDDIPPEHVATC
jgi:tRNA A37 methylthiotransferase MiaB